MTKEPLEISALLVAGGAGTRMKSTIPKQFLPLKGKALALYSFGNLCSIPEVKEVIVVCHPDYQPLFTQAFQEITTKPSRLVFAAPGERRQDSVWNGLQAADDSVPFVSIHDAARPFITRSLMHAAFQAAHEHGASAVGVPLKFTIKECDLQAMVKQTPDRTRFWEIQTPQTMRKKLLQQGFQRAHREKLTVTDDTALVELVGHPVKMVEGSYTNIKITTPEDLLFAELLIEQMKSLV